jgi:hypothetical protein
MRKKTMSMWVSLFAAIPVCAVFALALAGCRSAPASGSSIPDSATYEVTFRDDFSGYDVGDPVPAKGLWSVMHVQGDPTAAVEGSGIADVGNVLIVNAYNPSDQEKSFLFESSARTPANFKLETRFMITEAGGWPQLQISATGTLNGGGPLFWYLHLPAEKQIFYSHPNFDNIITRIERNLVDDKWHTMTLIGYGDLYTLLIDGNRIGVIDTSKVGGASVPRGTIQLRVQSMIAYFDYFEISEMSVR